MTAKTGPITITPEVMRAVARDVATDGAATQRSAAAVRATPALRSGDVGAALAQFRTGWSTALAIVADDARICARKVNAAAGFWTTVDAAIAGRYGRLTGIGSGG
jgi:hypothetical protein